MTRPNSLGPDTISFLQVLDQLYGLYKHLVDELTKIQQLQRALRGDLARVTQLQANGRPWDSYNTLRQHLILIALTYDTRVSAQPSNISGASQWSRFHGKSTGKHTGSSILDRLPATLKFKYGGKPNIGASQQGARGRASRGREARLGSEAGWATNPNTMAKTSYNPALPPKTWTAIKKSGRCYKYFCIFGPDHVCPSDAPSQEVPSREVRLAELPAMSAHIESPDTVEHESNTVGDAQESQDGITILHTCEHQAVSQPVIVHSSLDAITALYDEIRAMDL